MADVTTRFPTREERDPLHHMAVGSGPARSRGQAFGALAEDYEGQNLPVRST